MLSSREHRNAQIGQSKSLMTIFALISLLLLLSASFIGTVEAQSGDDAIYRIRATGTTITATDGGPDWTSAGGTGAQSGTGWSVNTGNTSTHNISGRDASLPAYVPQALFAQERWDPPAAPEMLWSFDVAPGEYFVRLYMGNGYSGTSSPGERVFDIIIEGTQVETGLDLTATFGHQVGGMKEYLVTSDASLDIEFIHDVENPLINGIEIIPGDVAGVLAVSPSSVNFGTVQLNTTETQTITLTNLGDTGDPSIVVSPFSIDSSGFTADFLGANLAPGAQVSFDVTFSADTAGVQQETITVDYDNGSAESLAISLQAEGLSPQTISFASSGLAGESTNSPTSLEFGPDGRLYVSQQNGTIYAYTIERVGENDYDVVATETLNQVKEDTPNHNDDGTSNGSNTRQVTGIMTAGTATNPILYVTSSDSRIAVGNDSGLDTNSGVLSRLECIGGMSGNSCSQWEKVDLVRGLPRSEENHSTNGIDLDPDSNILYVMSGGHANKGAPGNNFAGTPEYFLSAAMLSVDLNVIESMPVYTDSRNGVKFVYDLPTLDDPNRPNIDNTSADFPYPVGHPMYNSSIDPGDPFGGNNGLNQAIPEPGGPVQIHSPGYRNAYDVVFTTDGKLYTYDNGPNGGWGGIAVQRNADGSLMPGSGSPTTANYSPNDPINAAAGQYCTNEFNDGGSSGHSDTLNFVSGSGHYGGHQAPIRAFPSLAGVPNYAEISNGNWGLEDKNNPGTLVPLADITDFATYQSLAHSFADLLPTTATYFNADGLEIADFPDNPEECIYSASNNSGQNDPGNNVNPGKVDDINSSTNGLAEYLGSNFDGQMQGNLLSASFNGNITRYVMNAAGDAFIEKETLFSGFGGTPLDVTTQGDTDPFPGTIWAATYGSSDITVFEPQDFTNFVCYQPGEPDYDGNADYDNDGFTNDDEIDNGTDHCSGGSKPTDNDGDLVSDLNDPDDDNDTILDVDDAFAIDPDNGLTTNLPLNLPFWNNDPGTGFFGLGLTGLMTNGSTDYLEQFDENFLAAGGATGKLGVEKVTAGDAYQTTNNQDNAFQVGLNVDSTTAPFYVETVVESPFFAINGTGTTPKPFQSAGLQIGTGDQDNYLKLVISSQGGGGLQVLKEENAAANNIINEGVAGLLDNDLTLRIAIYPGVPEAQAQYSLDGGTTFVDYGPVVALPAAWFDGSDDQGLAAGIISTSNGDAEFATTWDYLNADFLPSGVEAYVEVLPNSNNINASTFGDGSFSITNNSTGGQQINSVTFDLTTNMLPEIVFDPDGTAGDLTAKPFQVNSDGNTGTINHTLGAPLGNGGFQQLEITFTDFDPGETMTFSIDVDPTSIEGLGAPGPGESGSVSGLELVGSTVSVEFDTGVTGSNTLYTDFSNAGSVTTVRDVLPEAPVLALPGLTSPATVNDPVQTITISGPSQQDVNLLRVEGAFFEGGGDLGQDPFEVNSVILVDADPVAALTLDADGEGSIDVTLTDSNAEGGYNYIIAVLDDGDIFGPTSNVIVMEYDADYVPENEAPVVTNPGTQVGFEGQTPDLSIAFNDDDGPQTVVFSVVNNSLPPGLDIEPTNGHIIGTIAAGAAAGSPYDVQLEATDSINIVPINFQWIVQDAPTVAYRVNTGGTLVPAIDGGPDWTADTGNIGAAGNSPFLAALSTGTSTYDNNAGSAYDPPVDVSDPSIPATTPSTVFNTERWDPPGDPEMLWQFPVQSGNTYEIRLYFAEIFGQHTTPGQRVFDVSIEGSVPAAFDDIDAIAAVGANAGVMLSHSYTAEDDTLDMVFIHDVQNPAVKAIEILTIPTIDNEPPVVTNPGNQTNQEGDAISLNIEATDPDTPLIYSAVGLPPSLTIDENTGFISGTLDEGAPGTADGAFIESNGLVVIEMESQDSLPNNWETIDTYSTTAAPNVNDTTGATGGDFIIWQGGQSLGTPGNGLMIYPVQINNPGTYQFKWRNQVGLGTNTTEHNDTWLKIEADTFFGSKNGGASIVCPNGLDPAENNCTGSSPNGSSSSGWFKVYSSGANNWSWSTNTSDNDAHQIFATFDEAGTYNILVSARSSHHAIDRMVLVNAGLAGNNGQSLSLPESQRASGDQGTAGAADGSPYDVTVTVADSGTPSLSTSVDFQWFVGQDSGTPEALVQITPGGGLGASTYGGSGNFSIANNSTGEVKITEVVIDLSTGILPDMVFDPVGTGGDATAQCFTPNGTLAATTGLIAFGDNCTDPFSEPRQGGFDVMTIAFDDFDPAENFTFSVDLDPNSIQGVSGAGAAGAVSGYEVVGGTVTITFSDGSIITGSLFEEGSLGGSNVLVSDFGLEAPAISLVDAQGNPIATPVIVASEDQIVRVTGTEGSTAVLLQMDSRLYIQSGDPPFNVPDETFYANEAMNGKTLYEAQIGTEGFIDIPVTLLATDGGSTPDGGLNQFIAVVTNGGYDPDGQTSPTSNSFTVKWDPTFTGADLTAAPNPLDFIVLEGETDSATFSVTASDESEPAVTFEPLPEWLSIDPDTSTPDDPMDFVASVDATTLTQGSYTADVNVTSTGYTGDVLTVSLTVNAEPALVINPAATEIALLPDETGSIAYTVDSNDASTLPTAAQMTITDQATGQAATWASTTSAANQGVEYTIDIDTAGLNAGETYTALVTAGPVTGYLDASFVLTLTVTPQGNPAALVQVNPGGSLTASTYTGNSFQVINTGDQDIVSVTIDLSSTAMKDVVYDPLGTAGDTGPKCLTMDTQSGTPGFIAPSDPCIDPFSLPQNGVDSDDGFLAMTLNYNSFNPGDQSNFSVDLDPNSIKNDGNTGDAGAINGFEIIGATVSIEFANGVTLEGSLFDEGSLGGSAALIAAFAPQAPQISVSGSTDDRTVANQDQTVDISGPVGANVTLLQYDARLYIDDPDPITGTGYNLDPFEANEAMAKVLYTGQLDSNGELSIPVVLLQTDAGTIPLDNAGGPGGFNHFIAVVDGAGDQNSLTSNTIVLEYDPTLQEPELLINPAVTSFIVEAGETDSATVELTANDGSTPAATPAITYNEVETGWLTVTEDSVVGSTVNYNFAVDSSGLAPGSYSATVDFTGAGYVAAAAQVNLMVEAVQLAEACNADTSIYAVNAGGGAYTSAAGVMFEADNYFTTPSQTYPNNVAIAGTEDDTLYQTERYGGDFDYNFTVDAGDYVVDLYIAEIYQGVENNAGIGSRIFSVDIEGVTVLQDFDPQDPSAGGVAGDPPIAIIKSYQVTADTSLDIDFYLGATGVDNAKISAICITPVEPSSNTAPTIDPITDVKVAAGETGSTSISASDAENDDITLSVVVTNDADSSVVPDTEYSFSDNGDGTADFSWAVPAGVYTATVTADDGQETSTAEFKIRGMDVNFLSVTSDGNTVTVNWEVFHADADSGTPDHIHIALYTDGNELTPEYYQGSINLYNESTAPNGTWTFDPVDAGTYTVSIVIADYLHTEFTGTKETTTITVEDAPSDAILEGSVTIQGRAGYATNLTVGLYDVNDSTPILEFTDVAVDSSGVFTVTGITPGDYKVAVKMSNSLQVVETVTLAEGSNPVDFGELRVGDANDDNIVDGVDFSILVTTFNKQEGDAGYNGAADFNGDTVTDGVDFSLLVTNFNTAGETP